MNFFVLPSTRSTASRDEIEPGAEQKSTNNGKKGDALLQRRDFAVVVGAVGMVGVAIAVFQGRQHGFLAPFAPFIDTPCGLPVSTASGALIP